MERTAVTYSPIKEKYHDRLRHFPLPKCGRHKELLGVANLGILARVPTDEIHSDLRAATANSPMPDSEIQAAIRKAAADHPNGGTYHPPPKIAPTIKNGNTALRRIIGQGQISDDADLWELSPIRLYDRPEMDAVLFLETVFQPNELIFIGDRYEDGVIGQSIRTAAAWIEFFKAGSAAGPYIIINPFTGRPAPKKNNEGDSYRCDAAIKTYRYCMVEFDNLNREDQIRFWSAARLPIRALIDSGGKSIHAWLDVSKISNVSNGDQWDREIKIGLYEKALVPLGIDRACCNPSRLSRLPGYFRAEKGRFQRLLWLSPEGREVAR